MAAVTKSREVIGKPVVFLIGEEPKSEPINLDDSIWPNSQTAMQREIGTKPTWDAESVKACIMLCRSLGMYQGAIVAQRPYPGEPQEWKVTSPYQWGIIMDIKHFQYGADMTNYHPLRVRWICPHYHEGRVEEEFFPGELFLIHKRPDDDVLKQQIEDQKNRAL